jgi:mannose-1-phosphate guanylyltransferase/mannose-6-phosphate isomerase
MFLEKPDATKAGELLADGCLWNSGNFMFRPDVMLAEIEAYAPDIAAAASEAVTNHTMDLGALRLNEEAFAKAPKISIDYAVMQKTKRAAVVKAAFDWSDIGTWGALWEASERDEKGNRLSGNVRLLETSGSLVHSEDVLTTVAGLDDVVVVTTRDAVFVASREASGDVKALVEDMKAQSVREASEHLKMYRPWGAYQRIDVGSRFQVKRITVKPGGRLSLQKHHHRSEHWVVVSGTAEVTVGEKIMELHENESTYIPIGEVHRLANPGKVPLEIIEVQVGSYTGEDDIVRLEDVYGRG